jgi:membrane associated rhomboid family serine protease
MTNLLKRFLPILLVTALCWLIFPLNNLLLNGKLSAYGIVPRHLNGLAGIPCAPFLHASYAHLLANTLPLLALGGILCTRSRGEFIIVTVIGIVLGGGLTWLVGRNATHIGASGLIFCYFGYLASLAYFHRSFGTLCVSVLCILAYGGILRGVVPTSAAVSWEGHLTGLVAGVALAWFVSKVKKTPLTPPAPGPTDKPAPHAEQIGGPSA